VHIRWVSAMRDDELFVDLRLSFAQRLAVFQSGRRLAFSPQARRPQVGGE
jgi:hypothetical protein